jgi:hypothetical protein
MLNAVVGGISSFTPTDADDIIEAEPALSPIRPLRGFDFRLLDNNLSLLYLVAGFVFDYIFTGKPRSLCGKTSEKLVELGFARFKLQRNSNSDKHATADEPLAIMAAAYYFTSQTLSLTTYLRHGLGSPYGTARGPAFEHFCAYLLALAFRAPTRLDSVFTFFHDTDIGEHEAQLVAAHVTEGNVIPYPFDITSRSIPTYAFGSSPSSEIETLIWMQNPARTIFCFPGHTVGPDIIFLLQLADGTLVPVLVQCKQLTQNSLSEAETAKAFSSIDPSSLISRVKDNGYVTIHASTLYNPLKRVDLEIVQTPKCERTSRMPYEAWLRALLKPGQFVFSFRIPLYLTSRTSKPEHLLAQLRGLIG